MDQLATLSEEARELALGRFRLLQPHVENGASLRLVAEDAEGARYILDPRPDSASQSQTTSGKKE